MNNNARRFEEMRLFYVVVLKYQVFQIKVYFTNGEKKHFFLVIYIKK